MQIQFSGHTASAVGCSVWSHWSVTAEGSQVTVGRLHKRLGSNRGHSADWQAGALPAAGSHCSGWMVGDSSRARICGRPTMPLEEWRVTRPQLPLARSRLAARLDCARQKPLSVAWTVTPLPTLAAPYICREDFIRYLAIGLWPPAITGSTIWEGMAGVQ
jgi:hypothetical protein